MLDWYACIPVGAGVAVAVAVGGEYLTRRATAPAAPDRSLYVGVPLVGLVALLGGSADHTQLQWLQVLGAGVILGALTAGISAALVAVLRRASVVVPVAAALLGIGALALVGGAHQNAWCLQHGSLDTLGNCIGALLGIVLGYLLIGCGAMLGLVFELRRHMRGRPDVSAPTRPNSPSSTQD